MIEIKKWKVYAEIPKSLWDTFRDYGQVKNINSVVENAIREHIKKLEEQ